MKRSHFGAMLEGLKGLNSRPMHSSSFIEAGSPTTDPLRVFVLYTDVQAAAHVKWLRKQLSMLAPNGLGCLYEVWQLNSVIGKGPFRETIARTAAESDVLVIAATALDRRHPELIQWLNSLAPTILDRRSPGSLIGLFGDRKDQASELNWMVDALLAFGRQTEMDFVWQWMDREAICEVHWLAESLEKSCARKSPSIDNQLADSIW